MKTKKMKILKALAMTGAFGIVATVPVIVSSCSSTNSGGATQTQKVTPKLKSSINLVGAFTDIYNPSSGKSTNDLLAEEIKNNLNESFENGAELENKNFDVKVEGNFSRTEWTGDAFADGKWGSGAAIEESNKLIYDSDSPQIDFSSLNDLKTKLSDETTLKDALSKAGVDITDSSYTIKNLPGLTDNNLIHVNVEGTKASTKTDYDLQIPVSDLNLDLSQVNVTISGDDVAETKQSVDLKFNIGIKNESSYTGPTETQTLTKKTNADSIVEKLGFVASTSSRSTVRSNITLAEANGSSTTTTVNLDNDKIGEKLGIFNTTFSNIKLTKEDSSSPYDEVQENENFLTYKMELTGKPNEGYFFENGKNEAQTFSFNVKVTEQTATFESPTSFKSEDGKFEWKNSGVTATDGGKDQDLENKLKAHAEGKKDSNIQEMVESITLRLTVESFLYNAHVKLSDDTTDGYIKYSSSNKWQVKITATPNKGYKAIDNKDFKTFSTWVTITIV